MIRILKYQRSLQKGKARKTIGRKTDMKNRLGYITILGLTLLLVGSCVISGCTPPKEPVEVELTTLEPGVRGTLVLPQEDSEEIITVLGVGDKLPYFSTNFLDGDEMVIGSELGILIDQRRDINEVVTGTLTFDGKIFLSDGTIYHAPERCVIDYANGGIIEGKIRVIKKK